MIDAPVEYKSGPQTLVSDTLLLDKVCEFGYRESGLAVRRIFDVEEKKLPAFVEDIGLYQGLP